MNNAKVFFPFILHNILIDHNTYVRDIDMEQWWRKSPVKQNHFRSDGIFSTRSRRRNPVFVKWTQCGSSVIYSVMFPAIKQNRFLKVHLIITREREKERERERAPCPKEVPTYRKNS